MNHRSAKFLHEVKKLTVDWRARLCPTHGLPARPGPDRGPARPQELSLRGLSAPRTRRAHVVATSARLGPT